VRIKSHIKKSQIDKNALYTAINNMAEDRNNKDFFVTIKSYGFACFDGKKFLRTIQIIARVKRIFIVSPGITERRFAQIRAQITDTPTSTHIHFSTLFFLRSIAIRPSSLQSTAALSRAIADFISNQIIF